MSNVIALKIKNARKNKGISQKDIAEKLNMSQSAYAKLENGFTKIDISRLVVISEILEVDPNEFIQIHEGKTFNFNNNQITNGPNENFYSGMKEAYETMIKHLKEEVAYLRKELSKRKP